MKKKEGYTHVEAFQSNWNVKSNKVPEVLEGTNSSMDLCRSESINHLEGKVSNRTRACLSPSKVKGNTLIEILVSLSVLSLLFVMGMFLLQQLTGMYSPVKVFQHRAIVREVLYRPLPDKYQEEEEWNIKGRRVVRSIRSLNKEAHVVQVKVSCFWNEQLMLERNRYITLSYE
ncbi:MAG: prepilin-type N-terminal cleavage/methylation domain-containing protein [Bacteroidota bacterium]